MAYSRIWLPAVLRSAGLTVALVPGWESRGHGDRGPVLGVVCHHTAGERAGNMPSLAVVRDGRPDLAGPLSQLGLGRDGTCYVVAAGRCYHAILARVGRGADACCAYREYARPVGRKADPVFDMGEFRGAVAGLLESRTPAALIPAAEPNGAGRPTLRRGDAGPFVERMQQLLGIAPDGDFGPATEAALRAFQRAHALVPDGILGPVAWAALDPTG